MAFRSRLTAIHGWGIGGGSIGPGAGGRSGGGPGDTPDTPDYAESTRASRADRAAASPSPVSAQRSRGPARGARGGTGGGTKRGGTRGVTETDPTTGTTVGASRRMAAVAAQTRERQRQTDMRQQASVAYRRAVQARLGKMDTAGTALTASAPITGPIGLLGGALVGGIASAAEREMAGEFTFGLGGLALGMTGLPTEAQFTEDFMAGNVTVDAKGNISRTDRGRAEQPEAEARASRPGVDPVFGDWGGESDVPSPMRAQRERPLAETPKTEKITPEQVLNPPLFEEPQAQVPGLGSAGAVPSWLRRVRADVERARMAGGRQAFI